jgi:hypothetical protein
MEASGVVVRGEAVVVVVVRDEELVVVARGAILDWVDRELARRRLTARSNVEKQTNFTNWEVKFEIRVEPSSRVDRPSRRRYFSSLRTSSIMSSTSLLAQYCQ